MKATKVYTPIDNSSNITATDVYANVNSKPTNKAQLMHYLYDGSLFDDFVQVLTGPVHEIFSFTNLSTGNGGEQSMTDIKKNDEMKPAVTEAKVDVSKTVATPNDVSSKQSVKDTK